MLPQRHISSDSGSETTISAGGAGSRPRCTTISSATARGGKMSGGGYRKQFSGQLARKREDAGMCKYPSNFPRRSAI